MARLRLLLLFISLFLLTSPSRISSADDSTAPYIYYYANTASAIVVERADGTDSHLIAAGVMPPNLNVISDLDWSPSGQWMAWRGGVYNPYGGMVWYNAWITRADGTDRVTLLDNSYRILALEWSPTDDLIYVNYFTPELVFKFVIIDPNTNIIVAQTDYQFSRMPETLPSGWLWDGSGIYFDLYYIVGELSITNQTSNRFIESSFYNSGRPVNLSNGRLLSYETVYGETSQTGIVMRDLGTEKTVLIASPDELLDKNQGFQAYWNPTMTHALILEWTCDYQAEYCSYPNPLSSRLYLLDWEAGTLQLLTTNMLVSNFERGPDKVSGDQSLSDFWSPDGRYAVITDDSKKLIVVDATTGQLFPRINVPSIKGWHWAERANALIFHSGLGRRLYRYDLTNWTLSPLDMTSWLASWFSPSPDGRFIGILNGYDSPDMVDLKTNSKRRWPHHSLGSSAGPIIDYEWHPDSRWFMTGEWTTFAGGGPGPSAVTLFNTAGTIRREISFCGSVGSCAGFVPDRALPYLGEGSPESVIQQPESTLRHYEKVTGVAWSPDGSKIASYTGGKLHIWDVSRTPQLLSTFESDFYCNPHPYTCRLTWNADGATITLTDYTQSETWNIQYGIPVKNPETVINSPFLSSDGETLFTETSTDETRTMLVQNDNTTLTLTFNDGYGGIDSADLRPDGDYIVGARLDHRIFVWDAESGEQLSDLNFYARAVTLSPDGTRLAAAGSSLVTKQ